MTRIEDSAGIVQWVSLSPDRRLLAAAGADGTLRLWNVAAPGHPVPVATWCRPTGRIRCTRRRSARTGRCSRRRAPDAVVPLWKVADPAHRGPVGRPLTGPASTIYSVAFSPDGRRSPRAAPTAPSGCGTSPTRRRPTGRRAADRAGRSYVNSVTFARTARCSRRGLPQARSGCGASAAPADPFRTANAVDRTRRPGLRSDLQPGRATLAASSQDDKVWLWTVTAGTSTAAGRHADRGGQLGEHGRVQPGRHVARGRHVRRRTCWCGTWPPGADRDAAAPAAGHVGDLGRPRPDRRRNADGTISLWALPSPVLATGRRADQGRLQPGRRDARGRRAACSSGTPPAARCSRRTRCRRVFVNATAFAPGGRILAVAWTARSSCSTRARSRRSPRRSR